ncbi:MAG TPA: hypothetical protein VK158_03100 [Acidobacteriota bacterium]|nr:hypothetical protein [Acidobacteriota bacterium]
MTQFRRLMELAALKEISRDRPVISSLDEEFLKSAGAVEQSVLYLKPKLSYEVQGDEIEHMRKGLESLQKPDIVPPRVGIIGSSAQNPFNGDVLILSQQQINADFANSEDQYLLPFVKELYRKADAIISTFGVRKAIVGKIKKARNGLLLENIVDKPSEFTAGPYKLSITLDTPKKTVTGVRNLKREFERMAIEPKEYLLTTQNVSQMTTDALALRSRLGALSRYLTIDMSNEIDVHVNEIALKINGADWKFIYNPHTKENVAVTFGPAPDFTIPLLKIICADAPDALNQLVSAGIYVPSETVLEHRKSRLRSMEHTSTYAMLEQVQSYFSRVKNDKMRTSYILEHASPVLEYIVGPSMSGPFYPRLLAQVSKHEGIRTYARTAQFKAKFQSQTDESRLTTLTQLSKQLSFGHEQNLDVNMWLYSNYHDLCKKASLQFRGMAQKNTPVKNYIDM